MKPPLPYEKEVGVEWQETEIETSPPWGKNRSRFLRVEIVRAKRARSRLRFLPPVACVVEAGPGGEAGGRRFLGDGRGDRGGDGRRQDRFLFLAADGARRRNFNLQSGRASGGPVLFPFHQNLTPPGFPVDLANAQDASRSSSRRTCIRVSSSRPRERPPPLRFSARGGTGIWREAHFLAISVVYCAAPRDCDPSRPHRWGKGKWGGVLVAAYARASDSALDPSGRGEGRGCGGKESGLIIPRDVIGRT